MEFTVTDYYMPRSLNSTAALLVIILLGFALDTSAQKLGAEEEARLGIRLVDDKEYGEGIKHLQYASSQDRKEYEYPFEIGRAFLLWNKPKKAEEYFYRLIDHPDVTAELFTLMADCYKQLSKPKKELDALERGIGRFPNSGVVHARLGQLHAGTGDGPMALAYWEKGIEVEPEFPDNYRHAAQFLSTQHDHLWTWLYGQTYLALTVAHGQPDIKAMEFVRKALFALFNMSKQRIPKKGLDGKIYEVLVPCAMSGADSNSLLELTPKLSCFVDAWSEAKNDLSVPVFEHLQKVAAKDNLNEYLFWLYGETDRTEMNNWGAENATSFNEFSTWVYWNGIEVGTAKPFNRLKN